jgi:cobalt-zinc-cadmium efflux system membrane fusion protein
MNRMFKPSRIATAVLLAASLVLAGCNSGASEPVEEHGEAPEEEIEKGPHNGRMLRDGDFALELAIFEQGQPPQFRIWASKEGKPIHPADIRAAVTLKRLGGKVDRFSLVPEGDHLAGRGVVEEPHSFDVDVVAVYEGRRHRWAYASYEGRTTFSPEAAGEAGLKIERAGPTLIGETRELVGTIALAPSAEGEVRARFPGPVMGLYKAVGDSVRRGELIARVESNESLQVYPIYAPMSGVVAERGTNVGDVTGSEPMFKIVQPVATVVEFHVFPRDLEVVRAGQRVAIQTLDGDPVASGTISGFLPTAEKGSGTAVARVSLPNPTGIWRPGMSLKGRVLVGGRQAPLAVRTKALQRFRDFTVVFAAYGNTYEVRMLELGQHTPEWTEVLGGLDIGTPYVTDGAFLVRADIEKSGASHDH